MRHLVFDLETIPDGALYTAPDPPPGDRTFPPPWAQRPIVIGALWLDSQYLCQEIGLIGGDGTDERALLEDFIRVVTRRRPQLVTYNGRGFDLPVVALRALRHGLSVPWYFDDQLRDRRSDEGHLDLCDALADHGASRHFSLHAAARLIGLPGKLEVDGSQVEALHRAGELDVIRRYCLADVVQTAFLYLRYRLLQGALDAARYRAAASELHRLLIVDRRFDELVARIDLPRLLLGQPAAS
jgi:3'-5' exonuclease